MEYLTNHNFEDGKVDGKLDPWVPKPDGSEVPLIEEDGHYYAQLDPGEKLIQRFSITNVQARQFIFKIELKVKAEPAEGTGQVQLIWSSNNKYRTYSLDVSAELNSVSYELFIPDLVFTNNVEVLVQPRFDQPVWVRSISLTDLL